MKYTLLFLFATVCLVQRASADSIRQAFEKLRSKKVKDHRRDSEITGAICTRNGMDKKDFESKRDLRYGEEIKVKYFDYEKTRGVCYNKHGPRCDKFLKEKECYYQQIDGKCCVWTGGRPGWNTCKPYELRSHKEISEEVCPYPCGCIFSGKPSRKTSSINRVQKLKVKGGGCYSKENWNQVKKVLDSWNVPDETYDEFEMGTLMDRNDFVAFDYFMQPNKNSARYGLAFGATRCHGQTIEFGYMFTGMWEVDTNTQRRCSSGGGKHSCHSTGISDKQVKLGRKTLEYYAWDNLGSTSFRSFDVSMEDLDNEDQFEPPQSDGIFERYTQPTHKSLWENNQKPYNNDLDRYSNGGLELDNNDGWMDINSARASRKNPTEHSYKRREEQNAKLYVRQRHSVPQYYSNALGYELVNDYSNDDLGYDGEDEEEEEQFSGSNSIKRGPQYPRVWEENRKQEYFVEKNKGFNYRMEQRAGRGRI